MNILTLALCEGRHEMPSQVAGAIFGNTINPLDVEGLEIEAKASIENWEEKLFPEEGEAYAEELHLYVTGLTVALVAVLNVARKLYLPVTLYHYDRETNTYYPQEVR